MGIRRVSLGAAIILYLSSGSVSKSLDVIWESPVKGTVYNPGSAIVAKWTSSSPVVSPGFKLCITPKGKATEGSLTGLAVRGAEKEDQSDGKCGVAIWPQVEELEDGFMVAIAAPDVMNDDAYYLEMQDDFGNVFTSPVFGLGGAFGERSSPSRSLENTPATGKLSETSGAFVGTPKHSSIPLNPSSATSGLSNSAIIPPSFVAPAPSTFSSPPDVLVSRRPVSTAAIAVPLSVVSGIILVAGLLCLKTRRELAKDRKRELKSLILSQQSSTPEGYGSVGEVQRALSVLSHKTFSQYSNAVDSMPVLMANPEPRTVTHDPYTPLPTPMSSRAMYNYSQEFHCTGSDVPRTKSLTANYTATGTVPCPGESYSQTLSFTPSNPAIPSTLLPAQMPPLHLRSESPGHNQPLPIPPSQSSSLATSHSTNVYDAIAAKLGGCQ